MILVPILIIMLLIVLTPLDPTGRPYGNSSGVRFRLPPSRAFAERVRQWVPFQQQQQPQQPQRQQQSLEQRAPVVDMEKTTSKAPPKNIKRVSVVAGSTTPVAQGRLSVSREFTRSPRHSSCSTPTQMSTTAADAFSFLCPELVVPSESQCMLLLPEINPSLDECGILCIDDVNGMPVMYVAYTLAQTPSAKKHDVPGNGKRLIVRSALEDLILASCMDGELESDMGAASLVILGRSEEQRGMIHASNSPCDTAMVTLWTGDRMLIQKSDQAKSTCIIDESGGQMACTRSREPRLLQVNPGADAGLAVIALLGSDLIQLGVVNGPGHTRQPQLVA